VLVLSGFTNVVHYSLSHQSQKVPSGMWLELTWRDLRHNEVIWSSGEVNRLIDELGSQGLPSIDFAHIDLT
jgi:hypothetical protein